MRKIKNSSCGLLQRSFHLFQVLCLGIAGLKASFIVLACLWAAVYLVDYFSVSMQTVATIMTAPILLQVMLGMYITIRAIQLLMNSQLHLVGIRKEIFFNCLAVCLLFAAFIFDPKSSDNLLNAKLITFALFSIASCWLFWIYCLQIVPMIIGTFLGASALGLSFVVGAKFTFLTFNIAIWAYFAFWLWRSPLQRQFKYESFAGLVDYCVDRLKIVSLKRALTTVKNKEHVLLMGEGDGYLNRIILAPMFSLAFTFLYVVVMRDLRELCLWMILMQLGGTKAKFKVTQSHEKLWLFGSSDRAGQFKTVENISLRLKLYPFFMASLFLTIWIVINPGFLVHGIAALCLSFLFITALDYYSGLITHAGKYSLMVLLFIKMGLMFAMTFMCFDILWYVLMAIILLALCVLFRERAKRNFLVANLSVRAS